MVPPPGQVWSIENKAYNCLAYLFINGKIPDTLKASQVRNAHPTFYPWKPSQHTTNWRTNFNSMKKLAAEGKLKWDKEMISDADKAELDGKIATVVRKYAPTQAQAPAPAPAGAAAASAPPPGDDEYNDEDVEGTRATFGSMKLDYDSDEDDDIFGGKKKSAPAKTQAKPTQPPAPPVSIPKAFQVIGGDRYYKMILPLLQFPYKDEKNVDCYCSIVHMPSGCAEKGIVDFKISAGVVKLIVNVTRLLIFHPTEFAAFFRTPDGQPVYQSQDHVKIHGHFDAVKKLKGSQATNRIFFVFEFKPDIIIDGDKVFEESYEDQDTTYTIPGFQLIKATTGKHPQIFAHFEFKQKLDGHQFAQADLDESFLEGNEDDSSSSSSSNDSLPRRQQQPPGAAAPPAGGGSGFFGFGRS